MNVPEKTLHDVRAFGCLLVASEGGLGLRPVARYAAQLAPGVSALELVAVTGNPRVLFPWIVLSQAEWTDAHKAMLMSSRTAVEKAAQHLSGVAEVTVVRVLDLSEHYETAAIAVGRIARETGAQLIAITAFGRDSRGHGTWRLDPEELVAAAPCPVLHLPFVSLEEEGLSLSKVMVAVDGSESSMNALRVAMSRLPPQSHVHVVYVVDHSLARRYENRVKAALEVGVDVLARAKTLLFQNGREGETSLVGTSARASSVPEAIVYEAERWGAHLLVMGSRGRGGVTRWMLGSVAERVLRQSSRPVLVCPQTTGPLRAPAMHETLQAETKDAIDGGTDLPPVFL